MRMGGDTTHKKTQDLCKRAKTKKRFLFRCTCVSASARQSRAQCCAREFCCKILCVICTERTERAN